ncbi:PREDICTED: uncharacterized protein LOC108763959 [Trachymyrmex cornetzi]|uniref:uncharacterized protein LOC108763959 n=1 Tax=Trachymyrmex cornetzi TaxID=471704 RepID=UPI00084EDB5B|nr:PREDICTED: uncharacterized protein LOC108763959 [Trachymyrmex cornetzi]
MQLTKINIQKDLKLSKSIFEENIFLIEKDFRKTLQLTPKSSLSQRKDIPNDPELQLIERIVQNDSFLKNLISLVEKEEDIPGFGKKERKRNNSICKVKLSPPLEEDWQGQESTGFDNSGSTDKCDSIVKYKFMVPNHYAKHQSIAKTPEEHIKIFKIFSCFDQLINISEKVLSADSIVESIESVTKCSNFEKYSKRSPKNSLTIYIYKEKDFGENFKCQIIKVQEFEKILKESIIKIKDSEEILTNQVTKKDINNSLTLTIIDLETSYHQQLIQRGLQNLFELFFINHQFVATN